MCGYKVCKYPWWDYECINTIKTRNHCNSNLIEKFLLCTPIFRLAFITQIVWFFFLSLLYWLLYIKQNMMSCVLVTVWDNTLHVYLKFITRCQNFADICFNCCFRIFLGFQIVFVFMFTVSKIINKSKMNFFFLYISALCSSYLLSRLKSNNL